MPKQGYHHGNLRQALVDATLELIEEKGPAGWTLTEAAHAVGVTPAAVYRHFEGREDMIAEAARQGFMIFADLMEHAYADGQPSALAAFEQTGRAYLAFSRKYPGRRANWITRTPPAPRPSQPGFSGSWFRASFQRRRRQRAASSRASSSPQRSTTS